MRKVGFIFALLAFAFFSSTAYPQVGDNTLWGTVWEGGIGGDDLARSWEVEAGFDLDQDGKKEFVAYDADNKRVFLWESHGNGDNKYDLIWVQTYTNMRGGERSIMVGDLDNDGRSELILALDTHHPDSVALGGRDAMMIHEWNGTDNGIPAAPTYTWDPPRDDYAQFRLESESIIADLDNDGIDEILLTHRGGHGLFMSIVSLANQDFDNPQWQVEYEDRTTEALKTGGRGVADLNGDGLMEIVLAADGDKKPLRLYTCTGPDAYEFVNEWKDADFPADYMGTSGSVAFADWNEDGKVEAYLLSREGGGTAPGSALWVVTDLEELSTAFDASHFYLIDSWGATNLRGGILGDGDNDGRPDLYIATRKLEAIFDVEWTGGPGDDVTDPFNYQKFTIFQEDVTDGIEVGPTEIAAVTDLDGDGPDHQELVFVCSPFTSEKSGIYVLEFNPSFPEPRDNTLWGTAWEGGTGGNDYTRGWEVEAGFDLDQDGKKEFVAYDGDHGRAHLWESHGNGDNKYELIWVKDYEKLHGNDRAIMVGDLNADGRSELIVVIDTYPPDSVALGGRAAMLIYEWNGTDNGIPEEPTLTWDPPRDEYGLTKLESEAFIGDLDNDGINEMILPNRGSHGLSLIIVSLSNQDFDNPQWLVEYEDRTSGNFVIRGLGVADLNGDGLMEIVTADKKTLRLYSCTGPDTYEFVKEWKDTDCPANYMGTGTSITFADWNEDGKVEAYLLSCEGAAPAPGSGLWVVTDLEDLSTAFDASHFHLIDSWSPTDLRGGIIGDGDNDGRPDLYIATRKLEAIFDVEWTGGPGDDVTDPFNYQKFTIFQEDVTDGIEVGPTEIAAVTDLDGDGLNHQELVFVCSPFTSEKSGIYVLEFDPSDEIVSVPFEIPEYIPTVYSLKQNYPNPFNPVTNIAYDLPKAGKVTLKIYDILGREIKTLVDDFQGIGPHQVIWDATNRRGERVASGIYLYTLEAENYKASKKMLLLK